MATSVYIQENFPIAWICKLAVEINAKVKFYQILQFANKSQNCHFFHFCWQNKLSVSAAVLDVNLILYLYLFQLSYEYGNFDKNPFISLAFKKSI